MQHELLIQHSVQGRSFIMIDSHAVASIQQLKQAVTGSLLTPDDADYERARFGWNLAIDQHPALILIANDVQDIVAGVHFAHEAGLGIAVQSTGHGLQNPANDSLLIITSSMTAVQVDAEARTARVEAGALWKHVLDQAVPHGLAPLLGSSPHVGVVGYSLGGGIGWLARKYGLAADSVRAVDLVTADGVLRHASEAENSDLFWGLRGGGGNFGVVTALEFDLHPVASVYGGSLFYPGALAGDVLRFFRDWAKTVPDELTSSVQIVKFPSLPELPEAMRGKVQVIVRAAYTGDATKGKEFMQAWLDWHTPDSNILRETPFSEIGTVSNDPVEPRPSHYSNEMLSELSDDTINVIVRRTTDSASPLLMSEIRHSGGAIARVPADANAIGNRDAQFYLTTAGMSPTPQAYAAVDAYIKAYKDDLRPYVHGGVYLNFVKGSEARTRAKDAYLPQSYKRLVALKAKYDPDNRFRFSYQLVEA
jgi:FAD/FMN-containing dehydrogenase